MRAIAETRLGDLAAAHADLARLKILRRSNMLGKASFERIPEVEIALMAAEGRGAEAYERLRARNLDQRFHDAQDVYGSVRQITGSLERRVGGLHRSKGCLYFRSLRNENRKIVSLFYTLYRLNSLIDYGRGSGWLVGGPVELG